MQLCRTGPNHAVMQNRPQSLMQNRPQSLMQNRPQSIKFAPNGKSEDFTGM